MSLEDFDFSAIASTGYTLEEVSEALRLLHKALNPPHVITAPDDIPLSDTEYADFGLGGAWSMETGEPLGLERL